MARVPAEARERAALSASELASSPKTPSADVMRVGLLQVVANNFLIFCQSISCNAFQPSGKTFVECVALVRLSIAS